MWSTQEKIAKSGISIMPTPGMGSAEKSVM